MKIRRDTSFGYGTYEWQESNRRLEAIGLTGSQYALFLVVESYAFDYSITYDFEN